MTGEEVLRRIRAIPPEGRMALAEGTGLPFNYVYRVATERIRDPGSAKVDVFREYFIRQDQGPQ